MLIRGKEALHILFIAVTRLHEQKLCVSKVCIEFTNCFRSFPSHCFLAQGKNTTPQFYTGWLLIHTERAQR